MVWNPNCRVVIVLLIEKITNTLEAKSAVPELSFLEEEMILTLSKALKVLTESYRMNPPLPCPIFITKLYFMKAPTNFHVINSSLVP